MSRFQAETRHLFMNSVCLGFQKRSFGTHIKLLCFTAKCCSVHTSGASHYYLHLCHSSRFTQTVLILDCFLFSGVFLKCFILLKIAAYLLEICSYGGSPRCPPQDPDKSAIWKSVTNTSMCGRSSGAEPSSSHPPPALIASITLALIGAREVGSLLFIHSLALIDSLSSRSLSCVVMMMMRGIFSGHREAECCRLAVCGLRRLHPSEAAQKTHTNCRVLFLYF